MVEHLNNLAQLACEAAFTAHLQTPSPVITGGVRIMSLVQTVLERLAALSPSFSFSSSGINQEGALDNLSPLRSTAHEKTQQVRLTNSLFYVLDEAAFITFFQRQTASRAASACSAQGLGSAWPAW